MKDLRILWEIFEISNF